MSKNNNVNPGQYKVAGRERQGEDIVPQREKVKALLAEQERLQDDSKKKPRSRRSAK
jgi:hypothetical protein